MVVVVLVSAGFDEAGPKEKVDGAGVAEAVDDAVVPATVDPADAPKLKLGVIEGPEGF